MQNNTVKELIQKLGEDYWFEIWTDNSEEPIVDGRDCYNAFDDYYDTEVKKVVIDHPNDEELQVIKLYVEQIVQPKVQPEPEIQVEPIKLKDEAFTEVKPFIVITPSGEETWFEVDAPGFSGLPGTETTIRNLTFKKYKMLDAFITKYEISTDGNQTMIYHIEEPELD